MRVIAVILLNDLRLLTRDARTWLMLLAAPLLALWAISSALGPMLREDAFLEPFPVALTDYEDSVWSNLMAGQLERIELLKPILRLSEEDAVSAIRSGTADAGIVLPEGLSDSVNVLDPLPVTLYGSSERPLEAAVLRQVGEVGARLVSIGLSVIETTMRIEQERISDEARLYSDLNAVNEAYMNLAFRRLELLELRTADGDPVMETAPTVWYAAALLPVFLMLSASPVVKMLQQDRENGILSRYASTTAGMWQMLAARLGLSFLVSIAQIGLLLAALRFTLPWREDPLADLPAAAGAALTAATILASVAFAFLAAAAANSTETIDMIVWPGVLTMAVAGGCVYPLSSLPEVVRRIAPFLPTQQAMGGYLALFGGDATGAWLAAGRLILFAAAAAVPAALILAGRRRNAA